jgi:HTH-type transcriptional regulator/antitoxin HigA
MTTSNQELFSNWAIPPGETITENIDFLGIPLHQLAESLRLPVEAVEELISGERAIIPDVAVGLEAALGIPAQFWLNLEAGYRATIARNWEKTGGRKEEWTDWCFGRLLRKYRHEDAADRAAV